MRILIGFAGIRTVGRYDSTRGYYVNQAVQDEFGNWWVSKTGQKTAQADNPNTAPLPTIVNGEQTPSEHWQLGIDMQTGVTIPASQAIADCQAATAAAVAAAAHAEANAQVITGQIGEIAAKVTNELQTLQLASFGIRWNIDDAVKIITVVGNTTLYNKFKTWVETSGKPCEIKKDFTNFAYLRNEAGVASNVNWTERADGTGSHYATEDKNDYLQLVELQNINVAPFINLLDRTMTVYFNLDSVCPNGFYRWFKNGTKCMGRYDLTFNEDNTTLDCAAGNSQPTGTFSANNIHSMTVATNANLLNWTAWEIMVFGWLEVAYYGTFDVATARGGQMNSGGESAARNWVAGTTDTLVAACGAVGGGHRFMYCENAIDGKQLLWGAGFKYKANGKAVMTMDDAKANAAVVITDANAEITIDFLQVDAAGWVYPKNVDFFGMASEAGGSSSTGVTDGQYLTPSCANNVFYAGGNSSGGAFCGVFYRNATNSASNAYWGLRGRCALNR